MSIENHGSQAARAIALLQKARAEEVTDPAGALIKLRIVGELFAGAAAGRHQLVRGGWERADQFIDRLHKSGAILQHEADGLHLIRKLGNTAAHEYAGSPGDAKAARVAAESLYSGLGSPGPRAVDIVTRGVTRDRSAAKELRATMATEFPWGDAKRPGFLDTWQAEDPGRKYFVVRRGQIELSTKMVQVYPGSGVTEIGFINIRPIDIGVSRSGNIFTIDNVEVEVRVEAIISARCSEQCLKIIASQRGAVSRLIEAVLLECLCEKAALYKYSDAFFATLGFQQDVVKDFQVRAKERLPYDVEHAFVSIVAKNPAVHASHEAMVEAVQTKGKRRLEKAEARRRRKMETSQVQHELNIENRRLQAEQNAALLRIDLDSEAARAKNEVELDRITRLAAVVTDVEKYLAFVDPGQLIKLKTAKLTRDAELAKLMGRLSDEQMYLQGKGVGLESGIAGLRTQLLGVMNAIEDAPEPAEDSPKPSAG